MPALRLAACGRNVPAAVEYRTAAAGGGLMRDDPVGTIGQLIEIGMPLGIHCIRCGAYLEADAAALPLLHSETLPSLAQRFRCNRCGSCDTLGRPVHVRAVQSRDASFSLIVPGAAEPFAVLPLPPETGQGTAL